MEHAKHKALHWQVREHPESAAATGNRIRRDALRVFLEKSFPAADKGLVRWVFCIGRVPQVALEDHGHVNDPARPDIQRAGIVGTYIRVNK